MADVITSKKSQEIADKEYEKYGSYMGTKKSGKPKIVVVRHGGQLMRIKVEPVGDEITKADIAKAVSKELRRSRQTGKYLLKRSDRKPTKIRTLSRP